MGTITVGGGGGIAPPSGVVATVVDFTALMDKVNVRFWGLLWQAYELWYNFPKTSARVQVITILGALDASSTTFTLSYNGRKTAAITYADTTIASTVQTAVRNLGLNGGTDSSTTVAWAAITGGITLTITLTTAAASNAPYYEWVADVANLTPGTTYTVVPTSPVERSPRAHRAAVVPTPVILPLVGANNRWIVQQSTALTTDATEAILGASSPVEGFILENTTSAGALIKRFFVPFWRLENVVRCDGTGTDGSLYVIDITPS
jgi:hypothetical protein